MSKKHNYDSGDFTVDTEGPSWTDDEVVLMDEDGGLIIEEVLPYDKADPTLGPPGSNSLHDLLPSVEEYKANNNIANVRSQRTAAFFIANSFLALL